jgi:N-acetylneuraminic acid mutarotase
MIILGGQSTVDSTIYSDTWSYNPSADSWSALPSGTTRYRHTAVWTGTEMIVWGGRDTSGNPLSTGARFNPVKNAWITVTATGAPAARYEHSAVWTGSAMIIWGGYNGSTDLNTGGIYDPVADVWTSTSGSGAPGSRDSHSAVWTGSEMLLFAGSPISVGNILYSYSPPRTVYLYQRP